MKLSPVQIALMNVYTYVGNTHLSLVCTDVVEPTQPAKPQRLFTTPMRSIKSQLGIYHGIGTHRVSSYHHPYS